MNEDRLAAILHEAVKGVSPGPQPERIVARARRRVVTTASALLVVAGATVALAILTMDGLGSQPVERPADGVPVVVEETPAPAEPTVRVDPRRHAIPKGRRYVVASGTFGPEWGAYSGKRWRYLAWGHRGLGCAQFRVGSEAPRNHGIACSDWAGKDAAQHGDILDRTYDPGGGTVESIGFGTLSEAVATVEFRLDSGDVVRVDALLPPPGLEVPVRYYVAFLPHGQNGEMVALDGNGEELERVRLCHGTC